MKKISIICITVLTLALALGLFAVAASADTPHSHDGIDYTTEWSGSVAADNISGSNIVLTGNVTLTAPVRVNREKTANLCLNGYTLTMEGPNSITNAGNMSICDCSSEKTGMIAAVKVESANAGLQTTGKLTLNAVKVQNLRVWDGGGSAKLIGNTVLESTISTDFDAYVSGSLDVSEYTGEAIAVDFGSTKVPEGYTLFVGSTDTAKFTLYDTTSGGYLVASGNDLVTAHNHVWRDNDICFGCDAVKITDKIFPDSAFRTYVSDNFDKDVDGALTTTELAAVNEISVSDKGISSLKGVEYFTEITSLVASYNSLTSIDVSKNTKLIYLSVFRNQLTSIDLSKNTLLDTFYCDTNRLQSLDFSNNPLLKIVECQFNALTSITFGNNNKLTRLNCHYNQLTSLDLSALTGLEKLTCQNNNLTSLKLADGVTLKEFTGNAQEAGITVVKPFAFDMKSLDPNFDPDRVTFTTEGVSLSGTNLVISGAPGGIVYTYATGSAGHSIEVTLGVTIIDLIADIDKLEADLQKAITDLTAAIESGDKNLADEIARLKEADTALTNKIGEVNQALVDAKKELETAIAKKADTETLNKAIDDLTTAYELADAALKLDIEKLFAEDVKINEALGDLKAEDIKINKAISDLSDALTEAKDTLTKAIEAVQKNLDDAVDILEASDLALDEKIALLDEAYRAADAVLNSKIAVLKTNDIFIRSSIEALAEATGEAQLALQNAIDKVQVNLDNAKAELAAAIANGDTALGDKLTALDAAYQAADAVLGSDVVALQEEDAAIKQSAKALEASLAETKAALEESITALRAELKAADKQLDEKKANADLTYALIIIVGIVALGGNACWIVMAFKKKD